MALLDDIKTKAGEYWTNLKTNKLNSAVTAAASVAVVYGALSLKGCYSTPSAAMSSGSTPVVFLTSGASAGTPSTHAGPKEPYTLIKVLDECGRVVSEWGVDDKKVLDGVNGILGDAREGKLVNDAPLKNVGIPRYSSDVTDILTKIADSVDPKSTEIGGRVLTLTDVEKYKADRK